MASSPYRHAFYANDVGIAQELRRHHPVSEKRDDQRGESTILCSCGETFGPLPSGESVLDAYCAHFLAKLNPV